jgi:DNA-binding FadR family transcriptional regulator
MPSARASRRSATLAERMGISRPTIREALIALEVQGRVRIRVGSGIYVTKPSSPSANSMADEGPFELLRAREFIEGAAAEEAARHATDAHIATLDDILSRMDGTAHPATRASHSIESSTRRSRRCSTTPFWCASWASFSISG